MINNQSTALSKQIQQEIQQYLTETVQVSEGYQFSQYKLVKRISLFENHIYPSGKFDKQGNYKFWFDIVGPAIDGDVKNVDFDTKNVEAHSPRKNDALADIITNLQIRKYLRETGQAEEINSAIEQGEGYGNVVWKKVKKKGYERMDMKNIFVINQTAECLDESPVIERHTMSSSDLRAKKGVWENVKETLDGCKMNAYKKDVSLSTSENTTVPYFEIYERNGEVCLKDLKETNGETPAEGDDDIFVFAKVIAAGVTSNTAGVDIKYILFAQEQSGSNADIYKEYHRGRYKGRWWREGLYELLFDLQVRANQIGNQIARGLEMASVKVMWTPDKLIVQNILSDLQNGDIIRTTGLHAVDMRMDGLDQLIAEWNRILQLRNDIANSREIVMGIDPPSGQPLGTSQLLNQNAGKLFDFIREKFAIPFSEMFEQWLIPDLIKDMSIQKVLELTGDSDMMQRLASLIVDDWYINNMVYLPPHSDADAQQLKDLKMQDLLSRPKILMVGFQSMLKGYAPNVSVIITGEQVNLDGELQSIASIVQLEADPVRRSALVELMMKKRGIDVGALPKSPPAPMQGPVQSPLQVLGGGQKVATQ